MELLMQHDSASSGSRTAAGYECSEFIGTPFQVYLTSGYTITPRLGDDDEIAIEDLPGLIATVVQARVLHPRKLSGADLKFIRTALGLKSKDVAASIDYTAEHYSRCETGGKTMSAATEKAYRAYAFLASYSRNLAVRNVAVSAPKEPTPVSKKKADKAFAAFWKVFMEMKIEAVADAHDALTFSFSRAETHPNCGCCGGNDNDEPEWEKVEAA